MTIRDHKAQLLLAYLTTMLIISYAAKFLKKTENTETSEVDSSSYQTDNSNFLPILFLALTCLGFALNKMKNQLNVRSIFAQINSISPEKHIGNEINTSLV